MKWFGISGSWRITNKQVEDDVRHAVSEIISDGNGIVSGGALNVDFFATDEAMKLNSDFKQIKIYLPTTLETYSNHYQMRAKEGIITIKQAKNLIIQLELLRKVNPDSVIENIDNKIVDKGTYYERNMAVVMAADELVAFQVNESPGVQDTIDKAKEKNIPIRLFKYKI